MQSGDDSLACQVTVARERRGSDSSWRKTGQEGLGVRGLMWEGERGPEIITESADLIG